MNSELVFCWYKSRIGNLRKARPGQFSKTLSLSLVFSICRPGQRLFAWVAEAPASQRLVPPAAGIGRKGSSVIIGLPSWRAGCALQMAAWNLSTALVRATPKVFLESVVFGLGVILKLINSEQVSASALSLSLTYFVIQGDTFVGNICKFSYIASSLLSLGRLRKLQQTELEEEGPQLGTNAPLPEIKSFEAAITFDNVYFSYDDTKHEPTTNGSEPPHMALKKFSLRVRKGEKIAICGRSGYTLSSEP